MAIAKILLITGLLGVQLLEIHGHGMMLDPISRSSAWRKGFPVEPNYDDNGLYCGGINVQHNQNGGRCGICGDDYAFPQPRPNENGGIYGTGVIVQRYTKGQKIGVYVRLTTNHLGTFTFHLCRLENKAQLETEECFNQYPLQTADGSYEVPILRDQKELHVALRLPENVTCEQCVLRWTYLAGNNWGTCKDGSTALGCGPQETFKNCADIAIS